MDDSPTQLWLPAAGDALPECLLGVPLLTLPVGESYFRLVTSSVWTPLTWGDSVRARPRPDGGYSITALAAAGPHVRAVVTHTAQVSAMHARALAFSWHEVGALAIETLPGMFITAWSPGLSAEDVRSLINTSVSGSSSWEILETWEPEERTPGAVAAHFPLR